MVTKTDVSKKFNDDGQEITITVKVQSKYSDLLVHELPVDCYECPVGFSKCDCGVEYPFVVGHRPKSCKLRKINLSPIITDAVNTTLAHHFK